MKDFQRAISSGHQVLLDFFAEWCGSCQVLEPVLNEVGKELSESIRIIPVDIDKNPALVKIFKIRTVPTLILFKNGTEAWRKSGLFSKKDLLELLDRQNL